MSKKTTETVHTTTDKSTMIKPGVGDYFIHQPHDHSPVIVIQIVTISPSVRAQPIPMIITSREGNIATEVVDKKWVMTHPITPDSVKGSYPMKLERDDKKEYQWYLTNGKYRYQILEKTRLLSLAWQWQH